MKRTAYLLLAVTMLLWGCNAVAGKLAVGHVSPMLFNTLRWAVSGLVLFFLARPYLREDWPVMRENWLLLLSLGTAGMTGFGIGLYTALTHTSAINVSIEQASMPLVVFLANFLVFRIRVTVAQILGFMISILGVALTVSHGDLTRLLELELNIGDAIMMGAMILYGLYTFGLRFRPQLHWQTFMLALVTVGFATSLPFAVFEHAIGSSVGPTAEGWAIVAFAGLFPSLLAQILYLRGVEMIGSNRAGLFVNLVPIFGTLLSILVLGEIFHLYHLLALVLVLSGIWLAERRAPAGHHGEGNDIITVRN